MHVHQLAQSIPGLMPIRAGEPAAKAIVLLGSRFCLTLTDNISVARFWLSPCRFYLTLGDDDPSQVKDFHRKDCIWAESGIEPAPTVQMSFQLHLPYLNK